MALPVYANSGAASAADGADPTPGYPASISAGNLLLAHLLIRNTTATATTPDGWTLIDGPDSNGASRQWIFAKSASGSESGSLTIDTNQGAGILAFAQIHRFTDWKNDATMANNFEGLVFESSAGSTTVSDAGVTTSGADRLAVNFISLGNSLAMASFTGETGGDWTEAVAEARTTTANNGTLQLQTAGMASAGTVDGGSQTISGSTGWGIHGFAILPVSSGGSTTPNYLTLLGVGA